MATSPQVGAARLGPGFSPLRFQKRISQGLTSDAALGASLYSGSPGLAGNVEEVGNTGAKPEMILKPPSQQNPISAGVRLLPKLRPSLGAPLPTVFSFAASCDITGVL